MMALQGRFDLVGDPSLRPGASRARRKTRLAGAAIPIVDAMGPPISTVAWSPELVAQTLEILAVGLRGGEVFWLKPVHAESLRVGLPRSAKPGEVVVEVMQGYTLVPRVIHSTSWRYEEGRVILTYVAVVEPPGGLPSDSLIEVPVKRSEIARGDAITPPQSIDVSAVLEHAFRHLSWLLREDPAIAASLRGWTHILGDYEPEPFRGLTD
jgi:hypothetical protein